MCEGDRTVSFLKSFEERRLAKLVWRQLAVFDETSELICRAFVVAEKASFDSACVGKESFLCRCFEAWIARTLQLAPEVTRGRSTVESKTPVSVVLNLRL